MSKKWGMTGLSILPFGTFGLPPPKRQAAFFIMIESILILCSKRKFQRRFALKMKISNFRFDYGQSRKKNPPPFFMREILSI